MSSEDESKIIEHVVVVALFIPQICLKNTDLFCSHHSRGPEVEYVYPPLPSPSLDTPPSSPTTTTSKAKSSPLVIPSSWHLLPFMALPDGAHMVPLLSPPPSQFNR